ncbi:zinc protease [Azomonas agilis]|uniref:Zinc protease n=1 Tax=Azomonas agilis TaxID=116849 RepID=A0A562IZ15_9GAMM|nr:pitrilysin family protein [Azomonas agilis]TWH76080.1 zinc protease [Azomonas agilis]
MRKTYCLVVLWIIFYLPNLQATPLTPIVQREGISEYRLDNGLKIILAPDQTSSAIAFNILYLSGSLADPQGKAGTAHLLEHLLFKGTNKLPGNTLIEGLNQRGIRFNATTSYDRTRYVAQLEAQQDKLDYLIALEADRMRNTQFKQTELDAEREVVLRELEQAQSVPLTALTQSILTAATPNRGFGRPVLGTPEELQRVSLDDVRRFYTQHYQPGNAVIVITGHFEADKTLQTIERYFAALPSRSLSPPEKLLPARKPAVTQVHSGNIRWVALAYPLAAIKDQANISLTPLADILAAEPHGRLYQSLVLNNKVTGIMAQPLQFRQGGYFLFAAPLSKEQSMEDALTSLSTALEGFAKQPITEEELQRFKISIQAIKSQTFQNHAALSELLAEHAALGDWQLLLQRYEGIARLKQSEVQQQAQKHFRQDRRIMGELHAATSTTTPSTSVATPVAQASRQVSPAPEKVAPNTLDLANFNQQVMRTESQILRSTLDNGLKLALRPLPESNNPVRGVLNLHFGTPHSLFGKRTLADLVATLLIRGTQNRSYQQIVDQINSMGAGLSIQPNGEQLSVHFSAPKEKLSALLDLVAEILKQPAFPATEFELIKRLQGSALAQPVEQPAAVASLNLSRATAPYPVGDIRRHTEQSEVLAALQTLTRDEVVAFHQAFYGANQGELTLAGNFDPQPVTQQIQRLFGRWNSKAEYVRPSRPYRSIPATQLHVRAGTPQTGYYLARLHFHADSPSQDQAALFIAEHILGRKPLVSRLGQRLREQENLSYNVRSSIRVNKFDGTAWVSIQADYPVGHGQRLANIVKDELAQMIKQGVSDAELEQAKQSILHERRLNFSQEQGVLSLMQRQLSEGSTLEAWAKRNEELAHMSLEQVNAAIRQHFRLDTLVEVLADAQGETIQPPSQQISATSTQALRLNQSSTQ